MGIFSRCVLALALACAVPLQAAAAKPEVIAVAWPTRSIETPAHQARVFRIAERLAQKLSYAPPTDPKQSLIDLSGRFSRAQASFLAGRLDDAAREFDSALAEAESAPHRLASGAELITAHMTRASIALARGERALAQHLLERALRYDPGLTLTVTEENPALATALADARTRLPMPPPISSTDLGALCEGERLLVVGRALGVDSIEWSRVDGCRNVATVVLPAGTSDEEVASLILDPTAGSSRKEITPRRPRRLWPLAVGTSAAGLGLAISGSVLVGLAAQEYDQLKRGCGVDATCHASLTSDWNARENAGWALLGIGGAALVGGVIWAIVDAKRHSQRLAQAHDARF